MEDLIRSGALSNLKYYILEIYKNLPFKNEAYQKMFNLMLHDGTPFVFHCTAGKDRTGFAAYLILKTLGVPDDCILEDYMLSNVYRSEENQAFTRQIPNIPCPFFTFRRSGASDTRRLRRVQILTHLHFRIQILRNNGAACLYRSAQDLLFRVLLHLQLPV